MMKKREQPWLTYPSWIPWAMALVLVLVTGYQTLNHDYNLDDAYVMRWDYGSNEKSAWKQWQEIWTTRYNTALEGELSTYGFRPMAASTLVLERALLGRESSAFSHAVNLVLYAACGLLLLGFFRRLFPTTDRHWGLLAMIIFLVHPLHTEVFNSLKNREELLGFCFGISGVILWFDRLKRGQNLLAGAWLALFTTLAILSKESYLSTIGLAWLVILLAWRYPFTKQNMQLTDLGPSSLQRFLISVMVPTVVVLTLFVIILSNLLLPETNSALPPFAEDPYGYSGIERLIPEVLTTLSWYLTKFVWPERMLFYYGYDMIPVASWNHLGMHVGLFTLLFTLGLAFWGLLRSQYYEFVAVLLWFTLAYVPISNLLATMNGIVADRLFFSPSAALSVGIALGTRRICRYWLGVTLTYKDRRAGESGNWYLARIIPLLTVVVIMAWLTLLAAKTIQRSSAWKDRLTLFESDGPHMIRSARGNVMIANMYAKMVSEKSKAGIHLTSNDSLLVKTERYFRRALDVDSTYEVALFGLGKFQYLFLNQPAKALDNLKAAVNNPRPTPHRYWVALGQVYASMGAVDSALTCWTNAMEIRPEPWIFDAALEMLYEHGDLKKGAEFSEQGTQWLSEYYLPYHFLGDYHLFELSDTIRAITYYQAALSRGYTDPKLLLLLKRLQSTADVMDSEANHELDNN